MHTSHTDSEELHLRNNIRHMRLHRLLRQRHPTIHRNLIRIRYAVKPILRIRRNFIWCLDPVVLIVAGGVGRGARRIRGVRLTALAGEEAR